MDYALIVKEATTRKRELVAELEKLDALIVSAAALAGMGVAASAPVVGGRATTTARVVPSPLGSPTRQAVGRILREQGRPMQTRDLVEPVRAQGIEVGGKNAVATLSARLSNSDEFRLVEGSGWWLKDEPLPGPELVDLGFEVADTSRKDESATSVSNQGGSEDAAALVSDPDHP